MYFTTKALPKTLTIALKQVEVVFNDKEDLYEVQIPQLDRKDYTLFKKILEEIHGKWNRKAKVHTFVFDPTEALNEIVEIGCFPQRKPHETFFTPCEIVETMISWGRFHYDRELFSDWRYLEPSAGQGFILDVLKERYLGIETVFDCFEIDKFNRSVLEKKGYRVIGDNFLTADLEPVYDYIIMNPPFNGRAGDYVEHIEKAFSLLAPKGELTAIVPFSFLTSTVKRIEDFRNKVFTYGEHAELSDNAFKESGTNTKCVMIRMTKYSDSKIKEFETQKTYYDTWDIYTGCAVVALENDSTWYKQVDDLVKCVNTGAIKSEETFLKRLERISDREVKRLICKEECSFRWDTLIRERVVQSLFETIVESKFGNTNPFASKKSRQLSLF